jgi:predicted DCC family thiol-disulfide oxidoreductase YuxK
MLRPMDQPPQNQGPIVLFDGDCNLCNASVQWILRRDRRARFRFGSLQSKAGRAALAAHGLPEAQIDSLVLLDGGRAFLRTDAALRIAIGLGLPWSLCAPMLLVPSFLRDLSYRLVARNRYRWFGRRETCMVPRPELRARFLDANERS